MSRNASLMICTLLGFGFLACVSPTNKSRQAKGTNEDAAWKPIVASLSHGRLQSFDGTSLLECRTVLKSQPPLLYPRLTSPHIAELDTNGIWFIRVVLRNSQFAVAENLDTNLAFYLFPWNAGIETRKVIQLNHCAAIATNILPDASGVPLSLPFDPTKSHRMFSLRCFPRICLADTDIPASLEPVTRALAAGDWPAAFEELNKFQGVAGTWTNSSAITNCFCRLAKGLETQAAPHFKETLQPVIRFARKVQSNKNWKVALTNFVSSVGAFLDYDPHPAPVWLDDSQEPSNEFSFVVAGDVHLHKDTQYAARFFGLLNSRESPREINRPYETWNLDEKLGADSMQTLRRVMSDEDICRWIDCIGREKLSAISNAKFVILVGDCVDGASSHTPVRYAMNFFGLAGPSSPYPDELKAFREILIHCNKPVFAVPGNHDAAVGCPGILNLPLDRVSWLLCHLHKERFAAIVRRVNGHIPALVHMSLMGTMPRRYDGLEEWQYFLGPLDLSFTYRDQQFVLLNSFNLNPCHRASVGGVALNTGGGVQKADAAWLENVLDLTNGISRQFLFMHHDPRAGQPVDLRKGGRFGVGEDRFGIYEAIDTPMAVATFGYGGLFSYSTWNGVYFPLVSPGLEYLYRLWLGVNGKLVREWMRHGTYWDGDDYCAHELVDTITSHLMPIKGTEEEHQVGITDIFFAHNNIPQTSFWLRDPLSRSPFRNPGSVPWTGDPYSRLQNGWLLFGTLDAREPPQWAQTIRVPDGRNAAVIRLRDVGDIRFNEDHGFGVVRVGFQTNRTDQYEAVSLPKAYKSIIDILP